MKANGKKPVNIIFEECIPEGKMDMFIKVGSTVKEVEFVDPTVEPIKTNKGDYIYKLKFK